MKKIASFSFFFFLAAGGLLFPQAKPDGNKALDHIKYLASDEMKGRRSGTLEYQKAAEYVAARMKEYGLQPGGDQGTYFQAVPFKNWTQFDQPIRLEILTPQHRVYFAGRGRDFYPLSGTGSGTAKGQIAFAGYGVVSEKPPWDDYENLDTKGKILLVLPDAPDRLDEAAKREWTLEKKVKLALEKSAVGMIEMDTSQPGQMPVRRIASSVLRPGVCPKNFIVLRAGRDFLDDVFYVSKKSWRDLVSKMLRENKPHSSLIGAVVEMEAHFLQEERTSPNVIGFLPGNDPKLKDECLVMGGHLDHLGIGTDGFVYPGADDNATSVAVTLETARALAASRFKPARTIVFASWAGEEVGSIGSRYYTDHPAYPLGKTALYMNIDMVGSGDSDLYVGGMYEYSQFFDIIKSKMDEETKKKLRFRLNYYGSDHTSFWAKGVTAISLRTGNILTEKLNDEHPEYHRPGDRPELIEPGLLQLASQYHYDILMNMANAKENLLDPKFRVEFVHKDAAVIDLHCDTIGRFMDGQDLTKDNPKGHIDIPKLKRGAVDLEVFACFVGAPSTEVEKSQAAKKAFDQIEAVNRLVGQNPEDLEVVKSPEDFWRVRNTGKTGILMGIEGGYAIENDLDLLRTFYKNGVRLMTLTHWNHTDWADASGDAKAEWCGLTEFGEKVVKEMNTLGMIIDVSHAHDETFWDVIRISDSPVVASHSCCRALSPHHRNMSDEMLRALAKNGGVIGINFWPVFLNAEIEKKHNDLLAAIAKKYNLPADSLEIMKADSEKAKAVFADFQTQWAEMKKTMPLVDVKTLVNHIDHVVKVTGSVENVGLGSDFDGISATPDGLEDIGKLMNITQELSARGYKEDEIRKILGGNFLRVFNAVSAAGRKARGN
jgi:membrane dipeptidase